MKLRCGETVYEVALRDARSGLQVVVDGVSLRPQVAAVAPGVFLLRDGSRTETFHCVRDGDAIHLAWRGRVYRIDEEREGAGALQRHAQGGLESPMPGKVIKLSAAPGDAVTKGQEILVVEAMKMENALRAPRDGRVKSIGVKVGDMVAPGAVLVELE